MLAFRGNESHGHLKAAHWNYVCNFDHTLEQSLDAQFIERIREGLPELPSARRARLSEQFGFSALQLEQMTGAGVLDRVLFCPLPPSPCPLLSGRLRFPCSPCGYDTGQPCSRNCLPVVISTGSASRLRQMPWAAVSA